MIRSRALAGLIGAVLVGFAGGLVALATLVAPAAAAVLQPAQGGQAGALGAVVAAAPTATGMFMRAEGVDGESQDKDHKNWIDLTAVGQDIHRSVPQGAVGGQRTKGGVSLEDIQIVKKLDKASPKLAELLILGKVIPRVDIDVVGSIAFDERKSYYRYELKNVLVTNYQLNADTGSVPVDKLTLNFEEVKVTYVEFGADGQVISQVGYSHRVN